MEADLRFIMLPPTCEAGYFYPGGVYEVNQSFKVFVFSLLLCALSILPTPKLFPSVLLTSCHVFFSHSLLP